MPNPLRALMLTAGVALFVSTANAATDQGPSDTASFAPYCSTHFHACVLEVESVYDDNLVQMYAGKHGCMYPEPADDTQAVALASLHAATHAIVGWLNANESSRAPKTDDAIRQALAALWPDLCKN